MEQRFCTWCGALLGSLGEDDCPQCGQPVRPPFDEQKEQYEQFVFEVEESALPDENDGMALLFDGRTREFILWWVLLLFGSVLSAGLLYPYLSIHFFKWKTVHTVIGGKRLRFLGYSRDYWFFFMKNFLLTLVTLGMYGFRAYINLQKWKTENVAYKG